MTILCAKGALLGRDISRPIVKYMGNIRREPKLFGRWQWRCDLLLPLQQQLVSRGSIATRSPRLDRIWTVDTAHSMRQGLCNGTVSIRLSLRLSVPSVDRYMPLRRVCCCWLGGQEISVDGGGRRASRQHGVHQQMRAVSRCQLT